MEHRLFIEIMGGAATELEKFYSELFEWKVNRNNPMKYGLVHTESESRGINGGLNPTNDGSNRVSFYVEVHDLQGHRTG